MIADYFSNVSWKSTITVALFDSRVNISYMFNWPLEAFALSWRSHLQCTFPY